MNIVHFAGGFNSTLITQGLQESVYMFVMGMRPKITKLFFFLSFLFLFFFIQSLK